VTFVNDISTMKQQERAKVIKNLQNIIRKSIITLKYQADGIRTTVGSVSVSVNVDGGLGD